MKTYIFSNCPYCGQSIDFLKREDFYYYDKYIGKKYNRCTNCKKIYSTGKKLYNEMSEKEKGKIDRLYYVNFFVHSFIWYLFSVVLVSLLILWALGENTLNSLLSTVGIILLFTSIMLGYITSKKKYDEMKAFQISDFEFDDDELKALEYKGHLENECKSNTKASDFLYRNFDDIASLMQKLHGDNREKCKDLQYVADFTFKSLPYTLFFYRLVLLKSHSETETKDIIYGCIKIYCENLSFNIDESNRVVDIINETFQRLDDIFCQPKNDQTSYNNPLYNISKQFLRDINNNNDVYDIVLTSEVSDIFSAIINIPSLY